MQTKAPITTSECPAIYLVKECITISAPKSNGVCKYGVAKVLSTTSNKLFSFAIMLRRSISHTFNIGLVGVSDQIILVLLLTHDFILDISSNPKK